MLPERPDSLKSADNPSIHYIHCFHNYSCSRHKETFINSEWRIRRICDIKSHQWMYLPEYLNRSLFGAPSELGPDFIVPASLKRKRVNKSEPPPATAVAESRNEETVDMPTKQMQADASTQVELEPVPLFMSKSLPSKPVLTEPKRQPVSEEKSMVHATAPGYCEVITEPKNDLEHQFGERTSDSQFNHLHDAENTDNNRIVCNGNVMVVTENILEEESKFPRDDRDTRLFHSAHSDYDNLLDNDVEAKKEPSDELSSDNPSFEKAVALNIEVKTEPQNEHNCLENSSCLNRNTHSYHSADSGNGILLHDDIEVKTEPLYVFDSDNQSFERAMPSYIEAKTEFPDEYSSENTSCERRLPSHLNGHGDSDNKVDCRIADEAKQCKEVACVYENHMHLHFSGTDSTKYVEEDSKDFISDERATCSTVSGLADCDTAVDGGSPADSQDSDSDSLFDGVTNLGDLEHSGEED